MSIRDEKRELRIKIRKKTAALGEQYKREADQKIIERLLSLPEYQEADRVFAFVGTESEIDTRPFLEQVLADGKILAVPLCVGKGVMEAKRIRSLSELKKGAYDILEPEASAETQFLKAEDLTVIPCLSCDHRGNRLGHGAGFYDRYFRKLQTREVMICREALVEDRIPMEETDHKFAKVLTEKGIYDEEEQD